MYSGRGPHNFRGRGGHRPQPQQVYGDVEVNPGPFVPSGHKQPRSRQQRARDSKRRDEFRENGKPIKEKEQEIKDLINKTLFFGFKEAYEAQVKQGQ